MKKNPEFPFADFPHSKTTRSRSVVASIWVRSAAGALLTAGFCD